MQNTHHDLCVDVLVVGAGPAGLTTGIALARHGVDVLVVERHPGTSPFPKATAMSTRTMELLRSWGLEQRVRAGAMCVRPVVTMSDTLVGPEQASMPFGYPSDEQALAVSPTTPACVPQDHLEPVLRDHLRERGGNVRFDTELSQLTLDAAGITADCATAPPAPATRCALDTSSAPTDRAAPSARPSGSASTTWARSASSSR